MSDTVEGLLVKIGADLSELEKAMKKGGDVAEKTTSKIKTKFKAAGKAMASAAKVAAKGMAILAAAATAAGVAMVKMGSDSARELENVAGRLGITTDKLQALRVAAQGAGATSEQLDDSLKDLSERIADAAKIGGPYEEFLNLAGLRSRDLASIPVDQQFIKVSEAIAKMTTQGEKNLVAVNLMADAGYSMIGNLDNMGKKVLEAEKRLKDLGITMNAIDTKKAAEANKAFGKLGQIIDGVSMQFAAQLGPVIAAVVGKLEEQIIAAGGVGQIMQKIAPIMISAARYAVDAWHGLGIIFNSIKVGIAGLSVGIAEYASFSTKQILFVKEVFVRAWNIIKAEANAVIAGVKLAFSSMVNGVRVLLADLAIQVSETFKGIADGMREAGLKGSAEVQGMGQKIRAEFGGVRASVAKESRGMADEFIGAAAEMSKAGDDMVDLFTGDVELPTPKLDEFKQNAYDLLAEFNEDLSASVAGAVGADGTTGQMVAQDLATFVDGLNKKIEAQVQFDDQMKELQLKQSEERTAGEQAVADRVLAIQNQMVTDNQNQLTETAAMWKASFQSRMQVMQGFFGTIGSLMNTESRKLFEIGKAGAMGETIINTYLAATKAYQSLAGIPVVGPGLGAAAAAAATLAGVANLNRIRNTKFGGGGSPSGGSAASSAAGSASTGSGGGESAAPTNQTNVNVSLIGERFGAQQVRSLVNEINDQTDDNLQLNATVG